MEEVPGWILAKWYREDVLKVLEPIDKGWVEEAEQRKEENRAKRAKQSAENKICREENVHAAWRQASDERKAAEQVSAAQAVQSSSTPIMTIAPMSQPLPSYAPGGTPLAYPSYYPHPYYSVYPYPYAYSHSQTVLNQGASSSQSASYIPGPSTYPYPYSMHPSGVTSCCPGCGCSRSGDELGARQCLNNALSERTGSIDWKGTLSECP
jgi:hypothetical protein